MKKKSRKKRKIAKKSKIEGGDVIHVKLNPTEAIRSKKDVLSAEMDLLKIAMVIKEYHGLRMKELETKREMLKKLRGLNNNIRHVQRFLPKVKIPRILQKEGYEEIKANEKIERVEKPKYSLDIQSQIQDIQEQLKAMAR